MNGMKTADPVALPVGPDDWMNVGRYRVTAIKGSPFFDITSRFDKKLDVRMYRKTFLKHEEEQKAAIQFTDLTDHKQVVADLLSGLKSKAASGQEFLFDYSIRNCDSVLKETGCDMDDLNCILRTGAKDGLLHPTGDVVIFPGVTTWFSYKGTTGSLFAFHREDMRLYSINYLHKGDPKIWFVVPPAHYDEARIKFQADLIASGFRSEKCPAFDMHKRFFVNPIWFENHGVPLNMVIQKPGEAVIVEPKALHMGFNTGLNEAYATNFAIKEWLPFGIDVPIVSVLSLHV